MNTYIALFRGINVGGSNILPMKELVARLQSLECEKVRTYIQSGNAVFRHAEHSPAQLSASIREAIRDSHGFPPDVLILTVESLERAVASNPFPDAETEPSKLHLFFLATVPDNPDIESLEKMRAESERFVLKTDVAYLHAPDGIGRSRLAARLEKALGVSGTGRNWRSVCKILEMATQSD
jgi:uncharacterized protein (DUF1697 family)